MGVSGKGWGAIATAARANRLLDVFLPSRALARLDQRRVTLSFGPRVGGCHPPPVLGDGAARTTASRCACSPCPLQPASLTLSARLPVPTTAVSHGFARVAGRCGRLSLSPRALRVRSGAARALLLDHPQAVGPVVSCWGAVARGQRSDSVCRVVTRRAPPYCFAHVNLQMLMYLIV